MPTQLVFKDLDVPGHQKEMLELLEAVSSTPTTSVFMPTFLTLYSAYLFEMGQQSTAMGVKDPALVLNSTGWTHPVFAPLGLAPSDAELFYPTFKKWGSVPADFEFQQLTQTGGDSFINADMVSFNRFKFTDEITKTSSSTEYRGLKLCFFEFMMVGLETQDIYIDTVRNVKDLIEASPLKDNAFAYGGTFTFYEVFLFLEDSLVKLILINLAVIFVCSAAILRSLVAAIGTTLVCGIIVFEIYGFAMSFTEFNFFSAGNIIMSMGLSVEFTAHFVSSFVLTEGDLRARMSTSMCHTFPALVEGGLSTFVACAVMVFHPLVFIKKYFFHFISMVVLVGLLNGMVFLPALLGFLDGFFNRCSFVSQSQSEEMKKRRESDGNYSVRMSQFQFRESEAKQEKIFDEEQEPAFKKDDEDEKVGEVAIADVDVTVLDDAPPAEASDNNDGCVEIEETAQQAKLTSIKPLEPSLEEPSQQQSQCGPCMCR